jgi:hypothetical protein
VSYFFTCFDLAIHIFPYRSCLQPSPT